jgi:hypothetical protein
MPIELDPDIIDTHAPVISALSEQLQQEAEAALYATDEAQQLLHVAGVQALSRALKREVALLMTAVRPAFAPETPDAEE